MVEPAVRRGFDEILEIVGGHGKYQIILLGIVSIQLTLLTFHHVGFVFLGAVPDYTCKIQPLVDAGWTFAEIKNFSSLKIIDDNGDADWDGCSYHDLNYTEIVELYGSRYQNALEYLNQAGESSTKKCQSWLFDKSLYESTTVTQFNLVCERRPLVATIQSVYMLGVLFGSFVFSTLSDKFFGRRKITLISLAFVLMFGILSTFAPNYIIFVMLRFFLGAGVSGSFQNCYVLLLEYSGPSYRAILGIVEQLPFAFGYMLIGLYAYIFRNWHDLQLAFTLSGLVLLSYIWILPESSRWLASNGRQKEAIKILRKVARLNNRPAPDEELLKSMLKECIDSEMKNEETNNNKFAAVEGLKKMFKTFWSLVKTPKLRLRSIVLWMLYFSVTLVYYGISFGSVRLSNDPFLLQFLSGLMEIPAYTVLAYFVNKIGRKPIIIGGFGVTSCVLIVLSFIKSSEYKNAQIALALIGKLFIASAFSVIYLLGAELYPTTLRTTGLGAAVIFGRAGSMAAPYFIDIKGQFKGINLPILFFGVFGALAALIGFLLPETKEKCLPDNVDDVELDNEDRLKSLSSGTHIMNEERTEDNP